MIKPKVILLLICIAGCGDVAPPDNKASEEAREDKVEDTEPAPASPTYMQGRWGTGCKYIGDDYSGDSGAKYYRYTLEFSRDNAFTAEESEYDGSSCKNDKLTQKIVVYGTYTTNGANLDIQFSRGETTPKNDGSLAYWQTRCSDMRFEIGEVTDSTLCQETAYRLIDRFNTFEIHESKLCFGEGTSYTGTIAIGSSKAESRFSPVNCEETALNQIAEDNVEDISDSDSIHESGEGFQQGFVGTTKKSTIDLSDASLQSLSALCSGLPAGTLFSDDDDGFVVCAGPLDWLRYKTLNYGLGESLKALYGGVFSYERDGKRRLAVIGLDVNNSSSPQLGSYCEGTEYSVTDDPDYGGIGGGPLDRRDDHLSERSLCPGGDIHFESVDSISKVSVTLPDGEKHVVELSLLAGDEVDLPAVRD